MTCSIPVISLDMLTEKQFIRGSLKKGIYIENTPLDGAVKRWADHIGLHTMAPLGGEVIDAASSLGRITAQPVFARVSSPFYHSSAMDGYAVKFADTFGASETAPKQLSLNDQAWYVDTGDPIPDGFNAVIMIEDVNVIKGNRPGAAVTDRQKQRTSPVCGDYIEIIQPATPWQHVRVIGEDIVCTELILPENHKIRPVDIGAVISGGHTTLSVRRKPKVVIIPTGSELVEPGSELRRGNIIEYNSRILSSIVSEWGGEPVRISPVPDDMNRIKQAVSDACAQGDIIIINAGSSAGSEDYTARAIADLGTVVLHGVNIKPGKPVVLGVVDGRPVLGIPGYPVSAYITFHLFAKELVYRLQGLSVPSPEHIRARLSRQIASSLGQEEFVRVKLGKVGSNLIATPVSRGAGVLMSLVRADGFLRIPSMSEGIGAGTEVEIELMRERTGIENTVVCIGSHDNALDLLANMFKKNHPAFSLSSAHTGSMGGLVALQKGEAHVAGTHLLDEQTGEYNIPYIKRILGNRKIILVNLVYRQQGFIVLKNNPKKILSFKDLVRNDVVFINRQAGSGTRLLTDKHLRDLGISPGDIQGYEREEYTHMGVASAVLTGIADTGMGILAAATALGLDFIPVARERYDIAIPAEYVNTEHIRALLGIIRESAEFRSQVEQLGGYDISDMGKVLYES